MTSIARKIDKIEPLIKIRRLQLDQQLYIAQEIQIRKNAAKDELMRCQHMYIKGIDRLNQERQSPERKMLDALERSVDHAKSLWHKRLLDLRAVEAEERVQEQVVKLAYKNLKMLEKLDERYTVDLNEHLKKIEQKQLDEFAIQSARRKI
ncbi:MAG: hypothetical protein EOP07_12675 [Proteobacteria bacterium]|nr:MAG: hypothetical protein EOP07_12675 [Pseudomonadota bacterium]